MTSRQQRRRSPARRGRRHRHPPTHLSPYRTPQGIVMTTPELTEHLPRRAGSSAAPARPPGTRRPSRRPARHCLPHSRFRCRQHCYWRPPRAGCCGWRSPTKAMTLVLQNLSERISPRVLESAHLGWTRSRGSSTNTSPAAATASTSRWIGRSRKAFDALVLGAPRTPTSATVTPPATPHWRDCPAPPRRCAPSAPRARQIRSRSSCRVTG